jgi:hypothetical protein
MVDGWGIETHPTGTCHGSGAVSMRPIRSRLRILWEISHSRCVPGHGPGASRTLPAARIARSALIRGAMP